MINDDELAIAFLAKSAANELHTIDQYTTQTSSLGPANRLNPISFIPSIQQAQQIQTESSVVNQQAIIDQLNREAAMAYPLPPPVASMPQLPQFPLNEKYNNTSHSSSVLDKSVIDVLEKLSTNLVDINETLNTIVAVLQKT
jgi:hypothetical protein